jgi:hypothetical protein
MSNLPYPNKFCCAKCGIRTDKHRQIKYRRSLTSEWLLKYFQMIEVDTNHYNFCCNSCYQKLLKLKKNTDYLLSEIASDKERINNLIISNKKNIFNLDSEKDDISQLSSNQMYSLTGLTLNNFLDLYNSLKSKWEYPESLKNLLFTYLIKMRLGLSLAKVSNIYPIAKDRTMYRQINKLRNFLMENFVPLNLGVDHVNRDLIRTKHTTDISKNIFEPDEDSLIIVWDGTYVYIQKSSNYSFQKQTYSMHKNRPLVKMMMIVTTTGKFRSCLFILKMLFKLFFYKGYILDAIGPYLANGNNNDANMTQDIINKQSQLKNYFKENDIFIVDRGFRDSIGYLNDLGLQVEMPCFLERNEDQHSTLEANQSRLVTKNRWVVEAINGLIKTWLYFNNVVLNINIPHIGDDFKIICSLINKYRPPRIQNSENDVKLANEMAKLVNSNNLLQNLVMKMRRKRSKNVSCDINSLSFPQLTEDYIRQLTFGVYQLKQARSYTREHINDQGLYEFEFIPESTDLIKVKLKSRHLSNTIYTLFIQYDVSGVSNSEPIKAYYCDCRSGARTIGCCAHIASVIWYLGYAKYNPNLLRPTFSVKLFSYCNDASN